MRSTVFLLAMTSIFVLTGCESSGKNDHPPEVGKVKVTTIGLDGTMQLTLNGSENILVSDSQRYYVRGSNTFVFDQPLESGEPLNVEISEQPTQSYCELKEEQSAVYDIDKNSGVIIFCETYGKASELATSVDVSASHACAILESGARCYSDDRKISQMPANLTDPQLLKAGDGFSCAVQTDQVICWGDDLYNASVDYPEIIGGVKELELGFASACLIDDQGLKCWGKESIEIVKDYPKNLTSPSGLVVNGTNACVLDSGKPYCWGYNFDQEDIPATLTAVTDIDIDVLYGCAVADSEVVCWSNKDGVEAAHVPEDLGRVSAIELGNFTACAVTDNGLRCWGYSNAPLYLVDRIVQYPSELVIVDTGGCAIQEDELICFGSMGGGFRPLYSR